MIKQTKITKGIILAGGCGSRLYPLTLSINKQLLPIYDKPLMYYPLTTLMLAGIRDILIITNPKDLKAVKDLLGTGERLGIKISYDVQEKPNGLPEAFIIAEKFIEKKPVAMILGDNFFHGQGLTGILHSQARNLVGSNIFVNNVDDPERYGVVILGDNEKILDIEEKPKNPKSNLAITGLYYFDGSVSERAKKLKPSERGELEIVDLIKSYMQKGNVCVTQLGRGYVWFDAGTPQSLLHASQYVEVIQSRQGNFIASPEEIARHMKYLSKSDFEKNIAQMPKSKYKEYLSRL